MMSSATASSAVAGDKVDQVWPHTAQDNSWFPRNITDIDKLGKVVETGDELDSDHPGFRDPVYRARRAHIAEVAREYRHNCPIKRIEYTQVENETWGAVYNRLHTLYPTHACRQLNDIVPVLETECGYGPDKIPQLEDVSQFLQKRTGWRIKPVAGLLTPREFLQSLAFRVFHSTQYIRHHTMPFYTPEPDVCHELLGHVPLFVDPEFAEFSQAIGLASLGASDKDIEMLGHVFWFTVEFGICKENGAHRAYGAGLLSSFGELQWCIEGNKETGEMPTYLPFDPKVCAAFNYSTTQMQKTYFVADCFQDVLVKIRAFIETLDRKFSVKYDFDTHSIIVVDGVQPEAAGFAPRPDHFLHCC